MTDKEGTGSRTRDREREERIEMKREWRECTGGKYRGKDRKGRRSNTEDGRRGNRKTEGEKRTRKQTGKGSGRMGAGAGILSRL